jgi:hypothetical protein
VLLVGSWCWLVFLLRLCACDGCDGVDSGVRVGAFEKLSGIRGLRVV